MTRCPFCAAENSDTGKFCSECGRRLSPEDGLRPTLPSPELPMEGGSPGNPLGGSQDVLLPGAKLANRYRVVCLLGKGGMGEVYQADDLKLGQTVALKFLPGTLKADPRQVAQFHTEVRLARQLSHPNVCRVYDIGEAEGRPFLSMEYIDGEDLASLLRRIGRLPMDKGIQIAHQLCSGLAAAHRMGILHRDLKPGNVMLDGRGNVRIADFGLACLAGDPAAASAGGTPLYMPPEVLEGSPASVQSDLFSLGLVLYEVFTGDKALTPGQVLDGRNATEINPPSHVVEDLGLDVEHAIMQCLQRRPEDRPASALAVSALLPGRDPFSAAIAAGEPPSPELVASVGSSAGMSPLRIVACLIGVILGTMAVAWLSDRTSLLGQLSPPQSPQLLQQSVRDMLRTLGYEDPGLPRNDVAYGFSVDGEYAEHLDQLGWENAKPYDTSPVVFWYRQGSRPLIPRFGLPAEAKAFRLGVITPDDPPMTVPGMVRVQVDLTGRLQSLLVIPPQYTGSPSGQEDQWHDPDWALLFRFANLPFADFEQTAPAWTPPTACDTRIAWVRRLVDGATERIEAAAFQGRPVYFHIVRAWMRPDWEALDPTVERLPSNVILSYAGLLLVLSAVGVLAYRNWRRSDIHRRGTVRMSVFLFAVRMLAWFFQASHRASPVDIDFLLTGLASALLFAALVCLFYAALEPYVRRYWPQALVSWNCVLLGHFRSVRLGRDVLLGALAGIAGAMAPQLNYLLPSLWYPSAAPAPLGCTLLALQGSRQLVGEALYVLANAVEASVLVLLLLVFLRAVLRKTWLADAVFLLILSSGLASETGGSLALSITFAIIQVGLVLWVLSKCGLVTLIVMFFVTRLLSFPMTAQSGRWYFESGLLVLGGVATLAILGSVLVFRRRAMPEVTWS